MLFCEIRSEIFSSVMKFEYLFTPLQKLFVSFPECLTDRAWWKRVMASSLEIQILELKD